jgi:hypothetical protein
MSKANNIKVRLDDAKVPPVAAALRTIAAYLENPDEAVITSGEQDTLADAVVEALGALGCFRIVVSHDSVRGWIMEDDEPMTAEDVRRVFSKADRSDLTCYEVRDILRSCADDVITERNKAAKKKGGRRA